MSELKPISVILSDRTEIAIDAVPERAADIGTNVRYVNLSDGERIFWSYGKSWAVWNGRDWICVRIGAGAYGDSTVWYDPDWQKKVVAS